MEYHSRLADQIVELQRLDEIGVPDHRTIGHNEIAKGPSDLGHLAQPFFEYVSGAEHGIAWGWYGSLAHPCREQPPPRPFSAARKIHVDRSRR
jgi:hypothetical protein